MIRKSKDQIVQLCSQLCSACITTGFETLTLPGTLGKFLKEK